jgi:hypothetical protein
MSGSHAPVPFPVLPLPDGPVPLTPAAGGVALSGAAAPDASSPHVHAALLAAADALRTNAAPTTLEAAAMLPAIRTPTALIVQTQAPARPPGPDTHEQPLSVSGARVDGPPSSDSIAAVSAGPAAAAAAGAGAASKWLRSEEVRPAAAAPPLPSPLPVPPRAPLSSGIYGHAALCFLVAPGPPPQPSGAPGAVSAADPGAVPAAAVLSRGGRAGSPSAQGVSALPESAAATRADAGRGPATADAARGGPADGGETVVAAAALVAALRREIAVRAADDAHRAVLEAVLARGASLFLFFLLFLVGFACLTRIRGAEAQYSNGVPMPASLWFRCVLHWGAANACGLHAMFLPRLSAALVQLLRVRFAVLSAVKLWGNA